MSKKLQEIEKLEQEVKKLKETLDFYSNLYKQDGVLDGIELQQINMMNSMIEKIEDSIKEKVEELSLGESIVHKASNVIETVTDAVSDVAHTIKDKLTGEDHADHVGKMPDVKGQCLFGESTHELKKATHLKVDIDAQYERLKDLPALVEKQIVLGVQKDGWADVKNIAEAFEYVDSDGVYVNIIVEKATGITYTWVQWYSGDTEIGYIFEEGTLNIVAMIGDGDIYGCKV
ncbi:MAG: hypothetical protein MK207_13035 [Saprospiraceae bacterium]|nr:hypothetical protein [Saprospiraceae bacterium]